MAHKAKGSPPLRCLPAATVTWTTGSFPPWSTLGQNSLRWAGKDKSLNVKGAYLEVWADMLGSLGVIVAALVIRFTGWLWVDPVVAIGIGLWVLPRTWMLLPDSTNIPLESAPREMVVAEVRKAMLETCGRNRRARPARLGHGRRPGQRVGARGAGGRGRCRGRPSSRVGAAAQGSQA